MASADLSLLGTFQKHIEEMRSLTLCKICVKPFYEPFILSCGHTYCYTCLASWFNGSHNRGRRKNCPDCRADILSQPSPNYLLRELVHMFIGRIELLPEDETVQEHEQGRDQEAGVLAADRAGQGLFKGIFDEARRGHRPGLHSPPEEVRGIRDLEDNVTRCPCCTWELENGACLHCGWNYDSDFDDESSVASEDRRIAPEAMGLLRFGQRLLEQDEGSRPRAARRRHNRRDTDDDDDDDDDMSSFIDDDDDDDDTDTEIPIDDWLEPNFSPIGPLYGSTSSRSSSGSLTPSYDQRPSGPGGTTFYGLSTGSQGRIHVNLSSSSGSSHSSDDSDDSSVQQIPTPSDARQQRVRRVIESESENDSSEESDDTAVRPPQAAAARIQRLNTQRARRGNHTFHFDAQTIPSTVRVPLGDGRQLTVEVRHNHVAQPPARPARGAAGEAPRGGGQATRGGSSTPRGRLMARRSRPFTPRRG